MMKINKSIYYILISELIFILLPLFIIIIVRCYEEKFDLVFNNSEWAVASIILFGQSLVKFTAGISNSAKRFHWQLVSLVTSIIIVVGLIPSVIVLIICLLETEQSFGLHIFEYILFALSILCFFFVGLVGQHFLDEKE